MIQPQIIDIELTNSCNHECSFCLRSTMKRPIGIMDIGLFEKIIDELCSFEFPPWGKVVLAGFGEPTLHPRFIDAVDYASFRGLPLRIYTNASRLSTHPRIRKCLLQDGIKSVKISLNVHGAELYREVSGSSSSWKKTVSGICSLMTDHLLQRSKTEITLQLLYSANVDTQIKTKEKPVLDTPAAAKAAIEFWKSKAAEIFTEIHYENKINKNLLQEKPGESGRQRTHFIRDGFNIEDEINNSTCSRNIHLSPMAENTAPDHRRQKIEEILLENIKIKLCPYLPYRSHFDPAIKFPSGLDYRHCKRHFNNIVIFYDGSCTPCCTDVQCQLYLGNVNQSTILEVFNSIKANENRQLWQAGQPPHQLCRICLEKS